MEKSSESQSLREAIQASLQAEATEEETKTPDASKIHRLIRKQSSFACMVGQEIGSQVQDQQSALARTYNAIFNSAKEISMHLRYSTGNFITLSFK